MIKVDLSNIQSFLRLPYEAAVSPRLKIAHSHLQLGNGRGGEFTGWVHLPRDYDRAEYERIKAAAKKIQSDSNALVVIGIGGSYLGARGVIECLCSPNYNLKKKNTPNIYFIGNGLSSEALTEVMELVEDVDFSVNVISKSGTTTEPAVAFRFFRELLEKRYGKDEAARRIYATTDAHKGALKSLSDANGYETFVVPDNIGGRYSVLTAVGLLPIAAAGIDIDALMSGAQEMMETCAAGDMERNPAWRYAGARYELYHMGRKIEILAAYEPSFRFMAEWWKQLYGESEGKENKGLFHGSVHSAGRAAPVRDGGALRPLRPPAAGALRRGQRRRPELPCRKEHGLHRPSGHGRHAAGPCGGRRTQHHRGDRQQRRPHAGRTNLLLRVCLWPQRLSAGRESLRPARRGSV